MNRPDRTNLALGRTALMGLAVALPMAVAAETGAATVRTGEALAAQRSESSHSGTWVDRVYEAARNLLSDSSKTIALPVIPMTDAIDDASTPAVQTDRSAGLQPDRLDHALIDLPPPSMV